MEQRTPKRNNKHLLKFLAIACGFLFAVNIALNGLGEFEKLWDELKSLLVIGLIIATIVGAGLIMSKFTGPKIAGIFIGLAVASIPFLIFAYIVMYWGG